MFFILTLFIKKSLSSLTKRLEGPSYPSKENPDDVAFGLWVGSGKGYLLGYKRRITIRK